MDKLMTAEDVASFKQKKFYLALHSETHSDLEKRFVVKQKEEKGGHIIRLYGIDNHGVEWNKSVEDIIKDVEDGVKYTVIDESARLEVVEKEGGCKFLRSKRDGNPGNNLGEVEKIL